MAEDAQQALAGITAPLVPKSATSELLPFADTAMNDRELQDMALAAVLRLARMERMTAALPTIVCSISEGSILAGEDTVPIDQCPIGAVRACEYQRSFVFTGNVYLTEPQLHHLFFLTDDKGTPLCSIILRFDENGEPLPMRAQSHQEALHDFGISLLRNPTPEQLDRYVRSFPTFFDPTGEFSQKTTIALPAATMPLEIGIQCVELFEREKLSEKQREFLFSFIRQTGGEGLKFLLVYDTDDDNLAAQIDDLQHVWEREDSHVRAMVHTYSRFVEDIETAEDADVPFQDRPMSAHAFRMANAMVKVAIAQEGAAHRQGNVYDWSLAAYGFAALYDLTTRLYKLPIPASLPREDALREGLSSYAINHASDPKALALIMPILELEWLDNLQQFEDGKFQQEATVFYNTMGKYLYETASETTGDTKQEHDRLMKIMQWMVKQGAWKAGDNLVDAGSGPATRMLRPYLESDIMKAYRPGRVIAVDRDQYPQPADGAWQFVQKDFTDEAFVDVAGGNQVDLMTHMWSPLSDLDSSDQHLALNNFNKLLRLGGHVILDVPAGYLEEMLAYQRDHPGTTTLGRISKSFIAADGTEVSKEFYIGEHFDLIGKIARAGFRIVNLPPDVNPIDGVSPFYETASGHRRATLILEKMGEPQQTLQEIARVGQKFA